MFVTDNTRFIRESATVNSEELQLAFDPKILRTATTAAVEKLKKNVSNADARGLQLSSPETLMEFVEQYSNSNPDTTDTFDIERFKDIIDLYIATGIPVYSPGYMGRQFSGVIPITGLTDLLTSMASQPSSFYESAQLPSIAEKAIAKEFGQLLGWKDDSYDMVTTSGGSLANITAILTARNCKVPDFSKRFGASAAIPAIAVSAEVHYSVKRATGILGIGEDQIISLPVNDRGEICMNRAESTLKNAEDKGFDIFCLVATAGTTALGAIDPLEALAALCRKKDYWLHVDGAHGGSLLVSEKLKHSLKGIEQVDSFALDAHKTLFLPASCTLLFYRNKLHTHQTFYKEASYIFDNETSYYDGGEKSFECTKRPMIMNLWVPWVLYGKEVFGQKLEALCNLATEAHAFLKTQNDFTTIHKPQTNIFCFHYTPDNLKSYDVIDFQKTIRDHIKAEGKFFISKVEVNGSTALRVVFMNHEITMHHFQGLLDEIRRVGQNILTQND
jgi:L-2,4-diaminobutyrate decarboxylase